MNSPPAFIAHMKMFFLLLYFFFFLITQPASAINCCFSTRHKWKFFPALINMKKVYKHLIKMKIKTVSDNGKLFHLLPTFLTKKVSSVTKKKKNSKCNHYSYSFAVAGQQYQPKKRYKAHVNDQKKYNFFSNSKCFCFYCSSFSVFNFI